MVLEGAFATIIDLIGLDEVVQFHAAGPHERRARYDAAIVSAELAGEVVADVVITLPDLRVHGAGGRRRGQVESNGDRAVVEIRDQRDVVTLLDRHVPLAVGRVERLTAVSPNTT